MAGRHGRPRGGSGEGGHGETARGAARLDLSEPAAVKLHCGEPQGFAMVCGRVPGSHVPAGCAAVQARCGMLDRHLSPTRHRYRPSAAGRAPSLDAASPGSAGSRADVLDAPTLAALAADALARAVAIAAAHLAARGRGRGAALLFVAAIWHAMRPPPVRVVAEPRRSGAAACASSPASPRPAPHRPPRATRATRRHPAQADRCLIRPSRRRRMR